MSTIAGKPMVARPRLNTRVFITRIAYFALLAFPGCGETIPDEVGRWANSDHPELRFVIDRDDHITYFFGERVHVSRIKEGDGTYNADLPPFATTWATKVMQDRGVPKAAKETVDPKEFEVCHYLVYKRIAADCLVVGIHREATEITSSDSMIGGHMIDISSSRPNRVLDQSHPGSHLLWLGEWERRDK